MKRKCGRFWKFDLFERNYLVFFFEINGKRYSLCGVRIVEFIMNVEKGIDGDINFLEDYSEGGN